MTSTADRPDAGPSWVGRELELDVGPIAHGGHFVARVDGRVVFVRHALPGERVRAVVTEDTGGSFCRADATDVCVASPDRVAPACAWARPGGCGGCDFQHVDPAAQRRLKGEVVAEQLRRLAGVEWAVQVEELPGGPLGWRTRVRLAVDEEGRAGLRAHRSHDVMPIDDCPLAPPGLLPPVLGRAHPPGRDLEVVLGARDVSADLDPDSGPDSDPHLELDSGPAGRRSGPVLRQAAGREWRIRPGVFWQVHPAMAQTLCTVVGGWAAAPARGRAWDLYGGVGTFAAGLAEAVGRSGSVTVVESDRRAVADGRAALADLPQIGWRVGRVDAVLPRLRGRPDVVVADPPRRGLGRAEVALIADRGPARVVYVACDPAALGRDVGLFGGRGYRLEALRAFDAFPMTHHVECVALLVTP